MKKLFELMRDNYLVEKSNEFKENYIASEFRNTSKNWIEKIIDDSNYKAFASVGQGNWSEIPWIAVFNKEITTSAMKGYYLVYLFESNLNKVYLSLNQGYTYFKNRYKGQERYKKICEVGLKYRFMLSDNINGLDLKNIKLNPSRDLGKGYECGHICGIEYDLYSLPDEKTLEIDLRNMLEIYKLLKNLINSETDYEKELDRVLYLQDNTFDSMEDKAYLDIIKEPISNYIVDNPKEKPSKRDKLSGEYVRNPQVALNALDTADYMCEVNCNHAYFESRRLCRNYVEAHHLIPMKFQDEFEYSIDIEANVVSLCPVCHRILHHGKASEIIPILEILLDKRKKRLKNCEHVIELKELIRMYGINYV